mmetsp:Transcript_68727/g.132672  ORF Transcript_68727/g.132672 Transcript_68727/m.132672 type:complete len:220 (-) Transcript_68727:136-795(-)
MLSAFSCISGLSKLSSRSPSPLRQIWTRGGGEAPLLLLPPTTRVGAAFTAVATSRSELPSLPWHFVTLSMKSRTARSLRRDTSSLASSNLFAMKSCDNFSILVSPSFLSLSASLMPWLAVTSCPPRLANCEPRRVKSETTCSYSPRFLAWNSLYSKTMSSSSAQPSNIILLRSRCAFCIAASSKTLLNFGPPVRRTNSATSAGSLPSNCCTASSRRSLR